MSKAIPGCTDFASPPTAIGLENSRYPFDRSEAKLKQSRLVNFVERLPAFLPFVSITMALVFFTQSMITLKALTNCLKFHSRIVVPTPRSINFTASPLMKFFLFSYMYCFNGRILVKMATEISQLWDIDSGEYMVKIVCTENLNPPYPKDF